MIIIHGFCWVKNRPTSACDDWFTLCQGELIPKAQARICKKKAFEKKSLANNRFCVRFCSILTQKHTVVVVEPSFIGGSMASFVKPHEFGVTFPFLGSEISNFVGQIAIE